jgi:hypothetical protein
MLAYTRTRGSKPGIDVMTTWGWILSNTGLANVTEVALRRGQAAAHQIIESGRIRASGTKQELM